MSTHAATYFDGLTARPHAVALSLTRENGEMYWVLEGEHVSLRHPVVTSQLTTPLQGARRFLRFPDGASCEMADSRELDDAQAAPSPSPHRKLTETIERRPILAAIATIVFMVAAIAAFQWTMPRLANHIAARLPASIERRLARETLAVLDQHIFQHSSLTPKRQSQLTSRFEQLVINSEYRRVTRLVFRDMRDGTANAFALPDGTVILTDRLVLLASDDDQIMAVLAHEIGHLHHRHSLRQLLQNSVTLLLVTSITGDTSALSNVAGALPLVVLSAQYSRDHEREADAFALKTLRAADIPPGAFVLIMNRMEQDARKIYGGNPPQFLSTHPPTEERVQLYQELHDKAAP